MTFVVAQRLPNKKHQLIHSTREKYAYACSKVLSTFLLMHETIFERIKIRIESPKRAIMMITRGVKNLLRDSASHSKVSSFST